MTVEKLIHTATEAAAILGVSTQTVYGMLATGQLRGFRDNEYTAWKVHEDAIKDCARRREAEALARMEKESSEKENNDDIFRKEKGKSTKKGGKSPKKPSTSK